MREEKKERFFGEEGLAVARCRLLLFFFGKKDVAEFIGRWAKQVNYI
jgi:hypothetical protein